MNPRNTLLACCCLVVLFIVACTSTRDEITANQGRGDVIIQAIAKYVHDHGRLPERLAVLAPVYLQEIPQTTRGDNFAYRQDDLQGYYLCFDVSTTRNLGCCYNQRLDFWDCGFGD